jgi:hypothetical protein
VLDPGEALDILGGEGEQPLTGNLGGAGADQGQLGRDVVDLIA